MSATLDQARGRWRDILASLGVAARFLANKHGPCPLCGGRDRYRFDDKDGAGTYFCNKCGAGSGITLVMKLHSLTFAEACAKVDEVIGRARHAPPPAADQSEVKRARLDRIIAESTERGIVGDYLRSRGLSAAPEGLLGNPALAYFDEDRRRVGTWPAMVAPVIGPDGSLQSVHQTWIGAPANLNRKKIAPAVETVKGAAVRLFQHEDVLGVAEGIETAIAAFELFGVPTWAAMTAGGVESFVPPPGITHLVIYGDHDANFAGQKAAYALAHRLAVAKAIERIYVSIPTQPDTDWLDVLQEREP